MIAKIKVAEAIPKTTKGGKPYLNVKSETGNYFNIWSENQFIFHKFVQGAELTIDYTEDGKFKTIVGIVGLEGENPATGQNLAGNRQLGAVENTFHGKPNVYEWLVEKINEINAKCDWLIEERKTLGLPEEESQSLLMERAERIAMKKEKKLSDLPVTELPDLNS